MSYLRQAAQQALEALEAMQSYAAAERKGLRICDESITALKAALEQQQAEPVAWGMAQKDGLILDVICPAEHQSYEGEYTIPLYTAPRTSICPLTDAEITKVIDSMPRGIKGWMSDWDLYEFTRAVEAAHGIKEGT